MVPILSAVVMLSQDLPVHPLLEVLIEIGLYVYSLRWLCIHIYVRMYGHTVFKNILQQEFSGRELLNLDLEGPSSNGKCDRCRLRWWLRNG